MELSQPCPPSTASLADSTYCAHLARTYASHSHDDETFEGFTSRYVDFFGAVEDLFELQRGLNNCFAYDLVPAPEVIEAALRAARRVNDYSTAVRVFEGLKEKVENEGQYKQYLEALEPVRKELGEYTRRDGAARGDAGMHRAQAGHTCAFLR